MSSVTPVSPTWWRRALRSNSVRLSVGVALMATAFMLAVPPNGGVDEQDHLVRAAATVRGDIDGVGLTSPDDPVRVYDVPIEFKGPINFCWARHPEQDASCQGFTYPPEAVALAYNGYYPPTYFALVGWPSLVFTGFDAMRPIRLASLAVSVLLFAWSLCVVRRRWGDGALGIAATVITPMAMFLSGTVNPQGLECAAAFAAWVGVFALFESRRAGARAATRWERGLVVLSGILLVTTRPLGVVFWAAIVAIAAVAHAHWRPRALVREREVVGVTLVAIVTMVLLALGGTATIENDEFAADVSLVTQALRSLVDGYDYLMDAVGRIGWLDIPAPTAVVIIWTVLFVVGITYVFRHGDRWSRIALALLVLGYLTVQIGISWSQKNLNGLNWQGRYGVPLLVGLPVLAMPIAARRDDRGAAQLTVVVAVGLCVSLYMALRRWTVGTNGPIWYVFRTIWAPPIGAWFVLMLAWAGAVLIASASLRPKAAP